jgi:beta-glucosidase
VSFPRGEAQLPPSARASAKDGRQSVVYTEGAKVGYRWFEAEKETPLFPLGHGLTYTRFAYAKLQMTGGERMRASFTVTNSGARAGTEIAQLYVTLPDREGRSPRRLAAWKRVTLRPGASQHVAVVLDRHALEVWNSERHVWEKPVGSYHFDVSASATDDWLHADFDMPAARPSPAVAKLDRANR